jgi:hypothetical protein
MNVVGYLGFLGFLGLLGLPTGNLGFYGFFGFFGFLGVFRGSGSDERVDQNINRACRNAFFLFTLTQVSSMVGIIALRAVEFFPTAFAVLFVVSMVAFVFSYVYYDIRGD